MVSIYSPFTIYYSLPIYLPEHDVERADDGDHVGDEVADAHLPQRLEVDEARRADADAVRAARAVRDEVTADLALRALDGVVVVAGRGLDDLRDLGVDGAVGQPLQGLLDDAARLAHLLDSDEVAVVGVAVLADGHVEVEVGVGRVGARLAYVPRDARAAQGGAGEPDGDGVRGRDDADADRPPQPDAVLREERLVLVDAVREVIDELLHVLREALVGVVGHPADAPRVTR